MSKAVGILSKLISNLEQLRVSNQEADRKNHSFIGSSLVIENIGLRVDRSNKVNRVV